MKIGGYNMNAANLAIRWLRRGHAKAMTGPCLNVPGHLLPRVNRVRQNLHDPRLTEERQRVLFKDKFRLPGEPEQRPYIVSNAPHPNIDADPADLTPPRMLYTLGPLPFYLDLFSRPYLEGGPLLLAIVGPIGPRVNASNFGRELAERAVTKADARIVSGFAEGIDQQGHLGALNASGRTIAWLPHGITNKQYYTGMQLLRDTVPTHLGGFVSEYYRSELYNEQGEMDPKGKVMRISLRRGLEFTTHSDKMLLLRDGRTTSIADAVIIIEAASPSGTEDTGRRAYLQGLPVFVVDWRMVELRFDHPKLPDVINGGLKNLADQGCAIPFPIRPKGRRIQAKDKVPWHKLPELFLRFILHHLEEQKKA